MLLRSQPMNGVVANGPISDTPAVQQGWPTLGDAAAPHKKKSVPPPTPELLPAAEVCAVQLLCPHIARLHGVADWLDVSCNTLHASCTLAATHRYCTAILSSRANSATIRLGWSQHHMMLLC